MPVTGVLKPVQLFPNSSYSNSLTNSAAAIYDNPGNTISRIVNIVAVNYDTSPRTVTLYLVPAAGSASNSNMLATFEVLPSRPAAWAFSKLVPDGYSLYAKADVTTKVNLFIDGTEEAGVTTV